MRQLWIVGAVSMLVLATAGAYEPQAIVVRGKPSSDKANPECPHVWGAPRELPQRPRPDSIVGAVDLAMGTDDGALPAFEFVASGSTTNIPEYHDCQRLVLRRDAESLARGSNRKDEFGPLAAVFGGQKVRGLSSIPQLYAQVYLPQGGSYAPLLLRPGARFGCLVLARQDGRPRAWMVPATTNEDCKTAAEPAKLTDSRRLSIRLRTPGIVSHQVARWDWDDRSATHFIGLSCGMVWCEVGPQSGFGPSPSYTGTPEQPAYSFKGLFDQQNLAEFVTSGLRPGGNTGTIVPTPEVAGLALAAPTPGEWVQVARIHMGPSVGSYATDYNFSQGAVSPTEPKSTSLFLCQGSGTACSGTDGGPPLDLTGCTASSDGSKWVARIDRPGSQSKYVCVLYRSHGTTVPVPPTARWRWRANDETIWISCPWGCCEVDAIQG